MPREGEKKKFECFVVKVFWGDDLRFKVLDNEHGWLTLFLIFQDKYITQTKQNDT